MFEKMKGMIPPIVTPLKEDESIDEEGLRTVVDFLVNLRVSGIFVLGTAGETAYMNLEERFQISKIVRDQASSSVPLLMGLSDPSLANSLKLLKHGMDIGVDGFVATLPQYFQLDSGQIKTYFTEIKKYCEEKPFFAYEVSEVVPTTARLTPKLVIELANEGIINGLKYSGVMWEDYALLLFEGLKNRENFRLFAGSEIVTRKIWEARIKFDGGIYSGLNVFPRIYVDLYNAIQAKNEEKLARIFPLLFQCGGIFGTVGSSGGPNLIKEMLKELGLPISTKVRSPLPTVKSHIFKKIKSLFDILTKEGYLDKYK